MLKNRFKYIILPLILIFVAAVCVLCSCSEKTEYYLIEYTVIEGGFIVGDVMQTVEEGKSGTTVTAVASEGYRFAGWSDNKTEMSRKEEDVTEDKTITAQFVKIKYYTIEYIADEGGFIVGDVTQTVEEGKSGTSVTAVASEGYRFAGWSDNKTEMSRKEEDVTEDKTITAQFVKLKYYTIEYLADEGGFIVGDVTQTVEEGKSGTSVTAVASEGYRFAGWSDNKTVISRKEVEVTGDKTITAEFEKIPVYEVSYTVSDPKAGKIYGRSVQQISEGESGDFVYAASNNGYRFVGWSDDSQDLMRYEENVSGNLELTAQFEEIKCSFCSDNMVVRSLTLNEIAQSDISKLVAYKTNAQFIRWAFTGDAALEQFNGNAVDYLQTMMLGFGINDVPDFNVVAEFKDLQPPYNQSNYKTIAHAMGGVNGKSYLNSKEAFEENYKKGFKFFEADISATSDGKMVLDHGRGDYTYDEFMNNKTADKTPMSLGDLFDYMTTYPEIWVDLDTLGFSQQTQFDWFKEYVRNELSSRGGNLADRIVIEITPWNKDMIPGLKEVGIKNFLYTEGWDTDDLSEVENICRMCDESGIKFASVACYQLLSWGAEGVEILKSHGISVLGYTTSDLSVMYDLYDIGVDCVFTDFMFV